MKEFLKILIEQAEVEHEPTPVWEKQAASIEKKERKGKRPDSSTEEWNFRKMEGIYQQLTKANRKFFALQKQKETVQISLDQKSGGILHRKEHKALQDRIDSLERQILQTQQQLTTIPKQHGFESVSAVKKAYMKAKDALEEILRHRGFFQIHILWI